jgi:hypothetical protein
MNMHGLADSRKQLDEWLANPEAWVAAHPEKRTLARPTE